MEYITLRNVQFQKITEQNLKDINMSNIQYFFVSQSGAIDISGNIYFFTSNGAFFMTKTDYQKKFIDKFLSKTNVQKWKKINLYFCDFLIINPKIYDFFIKELCAKNIRDFWFETAIDIFESNLD